MKFHLCKETPCPERDKEYFYALKNIGAGSNKVLKECEMCGQYFETEKHSQHLRKFCSKECHMKYVHKYGFRRAGEN